MEDVVIIGGGIAGLTAAIYAARADLKPIVILGFKAGGQLMLTTTVENFPCFPDGVQGPEMVELAKKQAEKFGAVTKLEEVESVTKIDGGFAVKTDETTYETKTVIVATGASARWLNLDTEKQFMGKGVHTCATCDAFFYKDKEIVVVGGGDSAAEESGFLSKFASKITLLVRRDEMRASKIMQKRVKDNPKITIKWNTSITEYVGGDKLTGVKVKDNKTGEESEIKIDGVFLAIGHVPNTKFLGGLLEVDDHGFIKTEATKTSVEGIFACGDVQDPRYKQAITAAGTGCMAAMEAEKYLESKA